MNEGDQAWQGFIQIVTRDKGRDLYVSQAWEGGAEGGGGWSRG